MSVDNPWLTSHVSYVAMHKLRLAQAKHEAELARQAKEEEVLRLILAKPTLFQRLASYMRSIGWWE